MEPRKPSYRQPWAWVPSLYFAQGIPYVVVMTVSVIMYKRMGISNTDIALYTSWLYLPWVIKPLWSPLVEIFRTKRFWIVTLQLIIGAALASVALTIPLPGFFQITLAILWLMAFSSATHDIAADGFYMLGLEQHQQAAFSGVRSTFYRIAMITGQGLLVVLAGSIETSSSLPTGNVSVTVRRDASLLANAFPLDSAFVPESQPRIVSFPEQVIMRLEPRPRKEIDSIVALAKAWNINHGFRPAEQKRSSSDSTWWERSVSAPLASFVRTNFGEQSGQPVSSLLKGNIGVIFVRMSKAPDAAKGRAVTFGRISGDNSIKVIEGERLQLTDANWTTPALVVVQADATLKEESSAVFTATSGDISLAWSVTFGALALLFSLFFLYHKFFLPYPVADGNVGAVSFKNFFGEFVKIFQLYFKRKNILVILAFLLLYRFAESQLVKLVTPFLLDPRDKGGLGLTTSEVGLTYGTVGIVALTLGGLLGGYLVSRQGLKFWLWPMVFIIHLPDLAFVYLSQVQPESRIFINAAVATEQFGYGFGFTAYMLYMILVSEGKHKTAHYAICTGFMALGMMIPGMFSGWLQELVGYKHFFIWIMLSTIPGFFVASMVKIDPSFGRKAAQPQ
ncbi:MAG: MFS transporter [Ignavibacteriales bacterium]|nr:MFS transporter [Ignavibacteriales bacterium]